MEIWITSYSFRSYPGHSTVKQSDPRCNVVASGGRVSRSCAAAAWSPFPQAWVADLDHMGTANESGKFYRARSRRYRSQILQVNMRLKALAEIYNMPSFAQLCNLNFLSKI